MAPAAMAVRAAVKLVTGGLEGGMARWVGLVTGGVWWGGLEGVEFEVEVVVERSAEGENMAAITAGLVGMR